VKTSRRFLVLIALLALLALTGCARVSRPEQNLAERLAFDEAARARYKLDADWWKVYQDDRLNQLVSQALERNLDLAKAALSVNRALYEAKLIAADLTPSFSGGLEGSARRNIKESGPSARSVSGQVGLSYELDLWRKVADAASAAQWEYRATVEDLAAARLALVGSVVDAYFQMAYLNDALAATEQNLKNYKAIEATVAAKHQAGKVAAVEPAQARQAVLSAENTLLDLRNQHQTTEETLRNLLNFQPAQPLALEGLTLAGLRLPELNLNIPLSVLANRPDLRAAEFRVEKAYKNVQEAEKGWLPSISLSSILSSSGDKVTNAFNTPMASGALSVSLPFLDWSRVLYSLRISETDFERIRLDFEEALTTALNEVDTCYQTYRRNRQDLTNTRRKYANDQRISAYYQDRYQAGAAQLSDWLSALNTTNSARLEALNSLNRAIQSVSLTYRALAGRYESAGAL
jgi:NodT family efflux transporter outer membrane factor (OMF) lipoprotein